MSGPLVKRLVLVVILNPVHFGNEYVHSVSTVGSCAFFDDLLFMRMRDAQRAGAPVASEHPSHQFPPPVPQLNVCLGIVTSTTHICRLVLIFVPTHPALCPGQNPVGGIFDEVPFQAFSNPGQAPQKAPEQGIS